LYFDKLTKPIRSKLQNKLIFIFSLIVLLLVFILTFMTYRQTTKIIESEFIISNSKVLELVSQNLDNYLGQFEDLSLLPRKDAQFMNSLVLNGDNSRDYIQNQVKNMFYSREDIEEISIYIPIDHKQYRISRSLINMKQYESPETEQMAWYKEASESRFFRSIETKVTEDKNGKYIHNLVYHRILINIPDKKPLAALTITMNGKGIERILSDISIDYGEFVGLFNPAGEPFYLSSPQTEGELAVMLQHVNDPEFDSRYHLIGGAKSKLMLHNTSPKEQWEIIKLVSKDALNHAANDARNTNLLVGSSLGVFFLIIIIMVAKAITRRIIMFARSIERFGDGDFQLQQEVKGIDEIAYVSRKFNQMVIKINELIEERYRITINERTARLKALEAQINPHFLYNALQAISTEAIVSGVEPIQQMVDALAETMRYCFRDGNQVLVADELQHIHNYLILQKSRFGDRLEVKVNVSEAIHACVIPKMLLQIPLENAIEHGLEKMPKGIRIDIEGERSSEGSIILSLQDDGPGIPPDRLRQIEAGISSSLLDFPDGMGLNNLSQRIRLMFNTEAGLTVRSEDGGGTEIRMELPYRGVERDV